MQYTNLNHECQAFTQFIFSHHEALRVTE